MPLLKMIHSLLPTMERQTKQGIADNANCPLCGNHVKTIHHVLNCQLNPNNYVASIDDMRKSNGIKKTQAGIFKQFVHEVVQKNPPLNDTVPSDQTMIGWRRIIQGKITYNYQKLISTTFQFPDKNVNHIGNLMLAIITQWKKAWDYRNEKITHKESIQRTNLSYKTTDLDYLYDNKQFMSANNKLLVMNAIKEHKQKSTTQIKSWLQMHYLAMKMEIQQKISQKHPDDNSKLKTQSRTEWMEILPCEAYEAPIKGPSE
jgi:hypothetical protein